jgi:Txe/YoeB family toxin of Txe-Axe toxin-antitoxin module
MVNNEQPSNYDLAIGFLQVFDLLLNVSQSTNDDIMKELQEQDSKYLEKIKNLLNSIASQNNVIITQNEKILNLLKHKTTD